MKFFNLVTVALETHKDFEQLSEKTLEKEFISKFSYKLRNAAATLEPLSQVEQVTADFQVKYLESMIPERKGTLCCIRTMNFWFILG